MNQTLLSVMHFFLAVSTLVLGTWLAAMLPKRREKPALVAVFGALTLALLGNAANFLAHGSEPILWLLRFTEFCWLLLPYLVLLTVLLSGDLPLRKSIGLYLGLGIIPSLLVAMWIWSDPVYLGVLISGLATPGGTLVSYGLLGYFSLSALLFAPMIFLQLGRQGLQIWFRQRRQCAWALGGGALVLMPLTAALQLARPNLFNFAGALELVAIFWICGWDLLRKSYLRPVADIRHQRAEAIDQLRQREGLLRALPIGLALVNPRLLSTSYCNAQFREHLNLAEDEILQWPKSLADLVLNASVERDNVEKELCLEGENGSPERTLLANASHFDNDNNAQVLLTLRDVSPQRQAEALLHKQREQLFLKQKLEEVGRLSAGIAHDFNNQLAAIFACADSAKMGLDSGSEAYAEFEQILSAGKRANTLIKQLLAFSRRRKDKVYQRVDVGASLAAMDGLLRRIVGSNIFLHLETPAGESLWANFDPHQLEQVVLSLINNAVDAMPVGGTIKVSAEQQNGQVKIQVRDRGRGMTDDVRDRIFEPFFSTKGDLHSGLGLAVSYGLVNAAGGQLSVERSDTMGTVMQLALPSTDPSELGDFGSGMTSLGGSGQRMPTPDLFPVAQLEGTKTSRKKSQHRSETPALLRAQEQPQSIPVQAAKTVPDPDAKPVALIVDDEAILLRLGASILSRAGFQVFKATSLAEARAMLDTADRVQLVVADLGLRDGSGLEALTQARTKNPQVSVVLISGDLETDLPDWPVEQGPAPALLQKPFEPDDLLQACGPVATKTT